MQKKVNGKENKREKQEEKLNEHSVGNLVIKKLESTL